MSWTSPSTVNVTRGMDSFLPYLSEVTNFWFGRMVVIAVFIIFLFGYMRSKGDDDFVGALAVSSYVTFVIGLLFWVIDLISGLDFAVIVGITALSSAILLTQKRN